MVHRPNPFISYLRDVLFPRDVPLWFSLAGNISCLCILFGFILVLTKKEKVERVTHLRRTRRFLVRLPRRIVFFNRTGPFVKAWLYVVNVCTRWILCGKPKEVVSIKAEPTSVSKTNVTIEIPQRGWNILYYAEYDIIYRKKGEEVWKEINQIKNSLRREKTDRTRRMHTEIDKLEAGTEYEVQAITRNPSGKTYGASCEFCTYHRPTKDWGFHGNGYTWTQTKNELNISFEVPPKTRGRQISVRCTGKDLNVIINPDEEGYPEKKELINSPMFDATYPESMTWDLDDGKLLINMSKIKGYRKWTCVFPGEPEVDPGLLRFFTDSDAHQVIMEGPQNMPEGLKDHYNDKPL